MLDYLFTSVSGRLFGYLFVRKKHREQKMNRHDFNNKMCLTLENCYATVDILKFPNKNVHIDRK